MLELTNSETIYQTCLDLQNAGRKISRKVLQDMLADMKPGIIDDHVTRMVENGRLRRVGYGVVEIIEQFPPNRVFFKTVLPNGVTKLELGDQLMEATPGELRVVALSLVGEAMQLAAIRGERDVSDEVAATARELRETQRLLADNRKRLDEMARRVAQLQARAQSELQLI